MAGRLSPDIILSDISMPVMNGIEMAAVLRRTRPEIRILFISSYDDFSFAKSAIDLSIYGYILKPINKAEIENSLRKVVELCDLERDKLLANARLEKELEEAMPLLRAEFFRRLLLNGDDAREGEIRSRMRFLGIPAADFVNAAVISMRFSPFSAGGSARNLYMESLAVTNILRDCGAGCHVEVSRLAQAEYISILFFDEPDTGVCVNLSLDYVMRAYENLQSSLRIQPVFGISDISGEGAGIPLLLSHARQAAENKFYSGGNPVNLFSEIDDAGGDGDGALFSLRELQGDIDEYVFLGDDADVDMFLGKYVGGCPAADGELYFKSLAYSIVNILQLKLLQKGMSFGDIFENEAVLWKKLSAFETITDLRQWLGNVAFSVRRTVEANNKNRNAQIVGAIKKLINENFSQALTVAGIASAVYMSPKQADSIFRKAMGSSIFDYVLNVRMENAKELLRKSDDKIISVAESVGYSNKSHFALMFKRYTGMTPAQYKDASGRQTYA
jgi:AraC-like DNA-binding protein/CheY-like chemotaxis protein